MTFLDLQLPNSNLYFLCHMCSPCASEPSEIHGLARADSSPIWSHLNWWHLQCSISRKVNSVRLYLQHFFGVGKRNYPRLAKDLAKIKQNKITWEKGMHRLCFNCLLLTHWWWRFSLLSVMGIAKHIIPDLETWEQQFISHKYSHCGVEHTMQGTGTVNKNGWER
jgi:hypothetical protein